MFLDYSKKNDCFGFELFNSFDSKQKKIINKLNILLFRQIKRDNKICNLTVRKRKLDDIQTGCSDNRMFSRNKTKTNGEKDCDSTTTPLSVVKLIQHLFGIKFTFDPCSYKGKDIFDGLSLDNRWGLFNFVNPPYSCVKKWIIKALNELNFGSTSIFLVPFRNKSKYWVEHIYPNYKSILFLPSIIFSGHDKCYDENMVVIYFERDFKIDQQTKIREIFYENNYKKLKGTKIYGYQRYNEN